MKTEPEENTEEEQPEPTGLAGGIGMFLAQELAQGGMTPPILAASPEVVMNQTGADLTLSDEEKKRKEEGEGREEGV